MDGQVIIIFGINIPEKNWPSNNYLCSRLTKRLFLHYLKKQNKQNITFLFIAISLFDSNNVCLAHFVQIFSTLVHCISNCLVVQLLTVIKYLKYVSTGMHSTLVDISVDVVLLQTSTSRFLSSLIFLSSVPLTRCCITLQILSNGLWSGLLMATYLKWLNLLIFFKTHFAFVLFSQVMQQQTLSELKIWTTFDSQLCQKCLYQKLLKSRYLSLSYYQ